MVATVGLDVWLPHLDEPGCGLRYRGHHTTMVITTMLAFVVARERWDGTRRWLWCRRHLHRHRPGILQRQRHQDRSGRLVSAARRGDRLRRDVDVAHGPVARRARMAETEVPLSKFFDDVHSKPPVRVSYGIFMTIDLKVRRPSSCTISRTTGAARAGG